MNLEAMKYMLIGALVMALIGSMSLNVYLIKDVQFMGMGGQAYDMMGLLKSEGVDP